MAGFDSSLTYVTVNEDNSGNIGALVAALNTPASVSTSGNFTFTAPEGTTLAENTNYIVVVNAGLDSDQRINFRRTSSDNEDSRSRPGWSIFDNGLFFSSGGSWTTTQWKVAVDIRGYANVPPPEPEIAVLGLNGVEIPSGASTPSAQTGTNFGQVSLLDGTGSNVFVDRTFTIGNQGTGVLTLGADAVSLVDAPPGSRPGVFSVVAQPAETVAAGGSTTFTVRFDPASAGVESLWVSVANDDADEAPYRFRIGGNGVAAQLGLSWSGGNLLTGDRTADFGAVEVSGNASARRTFTVTNTGAGTLHLGANAVTLGGAAAAEFSVAAQPAATVAAGGSTTFAIEFDPDVEGLREAVATLAVANDLNHKPGVEFALQGRAVLPEITIAPGADVTEGADAVFTLTRTGAAASALTVAVTVSETGGFIPEDGVLAPAREGAHSVTFDAGSATATLRVPTVDDTVDEDASDVTVELAADTADPAGYSLGSPASATLTVSDNDDPIQLGATLSPASQSVAEGGTATVTLRIAADRQPSEHVQYRLASVEGTALGLEDFLPLLAQGVRVDAADFADQGDGGWAYETDIGVETYDDAVLEGAESFGVGLAPHSLIAFNEGYEAVIGDPAQVTIEDDDTVSVAFGAAGYTVAEGDSVEVTVTVTGDKAIGIEIPLEATLQGGATAADYGSLPTSVSFAADETSRTFAVAAVDDADDDDGESLRLGFGTLPDGVEAGSPDETVIAITDNDDAAVLPEITIVSGGDVTEGDPAAFTLTRTGEAADALTVAVEVSESGDVVAAGDEGSATVTFDAGSATATLSVPTENDAVEEDDSVVTVEIAADASDPPAWIPGSPGEAEVTVADDDAPPATLTVADARALEGEAVAFAVNLSRALSDPVTVQYDTSSGTLDTGTATAGTDYVAARGGTLTIPAGLAAGVVSVTTLGDAESEDDETFTLTLSNPSSNAALGAPKSATGTIVDDDRPDARAVPGGAIGLAGARLGTQVRDASIDVCWEPGVAVPGDAVIELRSRRFWIYPEPFLPWKEAARGDSFTACGKGGVLVTRDRLWRGLALTLEVRVRRGAEVLAISPQLRAQVPNHDDAELHAHLSAPLDDEGRGLDTLAGPFVLELYFTDPTLYVYTTEAVSGLEAADFAVTNGAASVEVWNVMTYKVTVTPDELGEPVTVGLPANAVLGVGESLTADGGNTYTRPNAASNTVTVDTAASAKQSRAQSPRDGGTALTASFTDVPAAHDGSGEFTLRLAFSEAPRLDFRTLRDRVVTVDGGTVRRARRVVKGRDDLWELRIRPDGNGAVTVALEATAPCGEAGSVCTADGKALANAPRVVVAGPPALSVADAEAHEGPGAALAFAVTLSRAVSGTVTVNYATADGTATAGADYAATSGVLHFAAGETARTVSVPVLEDSHDDDGETLTLRLSNPSGAYLADGAATGTIHNSDPLPGAWLSRFGRAASDRALDAIGRRFAEADRPSHLTLGGGFDRLRALGGQSQESQGTPMSEQHIQHGTPMFPQAQSQGTPMSRIPQGTPTRSQGTSMPTQHGAPMSPGDGGMPTQHGTPMSRGDGGMGGGTDAFARFLGVSRFGDLLRDASFFYRPGEEARKSIPAWLGDLSAWGETGGSRFSGSEGSLEIDGELNTATLGFDTRHGDWFGGLALAYAQGEGGYARNGSEGGRIVSTLTSLYPYARYEFNDRTSVWAALGLGTGDLSLTPERAETDQDTLHTGLGHTSVAFGGRTALAGQAGETGGYELALRSDARWNRTVSDTVTGMMGASGETGRVRLLLEGSGSMQLLGGVLSPTLEAGLRYDAGDAETGAGIEVGGALAYRTGQLTLQLNARGLAAHERTDYDEWGYSTSISWQPGEDGLGPRFTVGSATGATQSGVRQLWARDTAAGLARGGTNDARRIEAEFGWGFAGRGGKDRWEPFLGMQGAGSGDSSMRLGLNLSSGAKFDLDFEFGWRETPAEEGDYAAGLQGTYRW